MGLIPSYVYLRRGRRIRPGISTVSTSVHVKGRCGHGSSAGKSAGVTKD